MNTPYDDVHVSYDVRQTLFYVEVQSGGRPEPTDAEHLKNHYAPDRYVFDEKFMKKRLINEEKLDWGSKVRIEWVGDDDVGMLGEVDEGIVICPPDINSEDFLLEGFIFIPRPITFPGDRGPMSSEWRSFYEVITNKRVERIVVL